MPVATSDLYSVLRAIAEEWEQCQVDLKKHVIMCVRTFLSTTERDQDGHRILPMDRLDEAEREVQSHAASIRKLRDCACERLAFELRGDWSPKDVILCLETRAPTLETAIEAMPKPWHAFIIEQLREDFPEQLAAIEAKHHVGGPVEPQPAIAEQSPSQPLDNENEGVAKRGRCLAARWPAILEHLRELMDNGRPCPTYAAIQDKFKCTSTPVGRAFKEGRNEPAFERWCELGAVAQAEPEVLEDPELLAAFNEYAGAMKLTSDARAEGWQNLTKAPRKRQRELIDCMKKELSRPDE